MKQNLFFFILCCVLILIKTQEATGESTLDVDKKARIRRANKLFVNNRRYKRDYSVTTDTVYLNMDPEEYKYKYTGNNKNFMGAFIPDCLELREREDFDFLQTGNEIVDKKLKDIVETPLVGDPLATNAPNNDDYILNAVVDLITLEYVRWHTFTKISTIKSDGTTDRPTGPITWSFNTTLMKMEMKALQLDTTEVDDILTFVKNFGICRNNDLCPCPRYFIQTTEKIEIGEPCGIDLYNLAKKGMLYVEFGVQPLYYQMYNAQSCRQPFNTSYHKPNMAGILTGYHYNATYPKQSYWSVYARRHVNGKSNNNLIKISSVYSNPTCSLHYRPRNITIPIYEDGYPPDEYLSNIASNKVDTMLIFNGPDQVIDVYPEENCHFLLLQILDKLTNPIKVILSEYIDLIEVVTNIGITMTDEIKANIHFYKNDGSGNEVRVDNIPILYFNGEYSLLA